MNYWLDLFTGTTWEEFCKYGAKVSGFRKRLKKNVKRIKKGDILLCYVTGVMRWIGALEVIGQSADKSKIWECADFPERLNVKPIVILEREKSIMMEELNGKVEFYQGPEDRGKFKGFIRMSPNLLKNPKDGELILNLLQKAKSNPKKHPIDPVKWGRKYLYRAKTKKGRKSIDKLVSIPEPEEQEKQGIEISKEDLTKESNLHTEIQYHLISLGSEMGFDIWVAKNDRNKKLNGQILQSMPHIINNLPAQFDPATNKVIELIDVLWLKGNRIICAFEIECTTSIYSGLLRMSDLLALQPNINIKLYIVAPESRRRKVRDEILRPTFHLREKPISDVCGYVSIEELKEKITVLKEFGFISSMKPNFLDEISEFFSEESEV